MPKKQEQTLPLPANGFHPDMTEEDLLQELSFETVQPSYGYVRLKFTHGDTVTHKRLKVRQVDIMRLAQLTDELTAEQRQQILEATAHVKSMGYTDESWLQSLAACVLGLYPPATITDPLTRQVVWCADGTPQDLPGAMMALCRLGFNYWHVEEIANKVSSLTRASKDDVAPNS